VMFVIIGTYLAPRWPKAQTSSGSRTSADHTVEIWSSSELEFAASCWSEGLLPPIIRPRRGRRIPDEPTKPWIRLTLAPAENHLFPMGDDPLGAH